MKGLSNYTDGFLDTWRNRVQPFVGGIICNRMPSVYLEYTLLDYMLTYLIIRPIHNFPIRKSRWREWNYLLIQ